MSAVDRITLPKRPRTPRGAAVALWRGVVAVARAVTMPVRALVTWWHRSIQARVVLSVLSLSAALALVAGWVLLHQVTDGLLESKKQSALAQAAAGLATANIRLDADNAGDSDFGGFLNQLIDSLAPRVDANDDYSVVVIGPLVDLRPHLPSTWAPRHSGELQVSTSVPPDLVASVQATPGIFWAYTRIHRVAGDTSDPAIVVGSQVHGSSQTATYGLFYVFPLVEQQQTLSVVERGLVGAGIVLIVLLGTIAWIVTRQVVTPVRLARRIAERLAAGRLEERMHVRGQDDIARLGQSFNQMANGLQRQIRQLEELSRVQRRFVADVSHELRTPLTTVRMASDLLYEARYEFDAPTARSAELLQNELNRFEGLLTDLLEISRFDAGAAALELSEVDLGDVVTRVVDANTAIAEQLGCALVVSLPESPATVQADVRRVERIARNLIVNALEYGDGGDVEIAVTSTPTKVSLTVRDHGVGLKPGEENLVFNRFWRADPARARTRGGTGLGLSIALEDTMLHGGVIDARGIPGVGSVFRLVLPRLAGGRYTPPARLSGDMGSDPAEVPLSLLVPPAKPGAP